MADKVIISKSKLVALGDVIREKTGSSEKMTVDVMTETMRNHSGGKEEVTEYLMADYAQEKLPLWEGTTIPNSGFLTNVYFNTEMSIEEVEELVSKLDLVETSRWGITSNIYIVASDSNYNNYVYINVNTSGRLGLGYLNSDGFNEIFDNTYGWYEAYQILNFNINFNVNLSPTTYYDGTLINVGLQNELLKDLISSKPFNIRVDGFCSNVANAIRTRKKTTDSINAQNFDDEILSIEDDAKVVEFIAKDKDIEVGASGDVYLDLNAFTPEELNALLLEVCVEHRPNMANQAIALFKTNADKYIIIENVFSDSPILMLLDYKTFRSKFLFQKGEFLTIDGYKDLKECYSNPILTKVEIIENDNQDFPTAYPVDCPEITNKLFYIGKKDIKVEAKLDVTSEELNKLNKVEIVTPTESKMIGDSTGESTGNASMVPMTLEYNNPNIKNMYYGMTIPVWNKLKVNVVETVDVIARLNRGVSFKDLCNNEEEAFAFLNEYNWNTLFYATLMNYYLPTEEDLANGYTPSFDGFGSTVDVSVNFNFITDENGDYAFRVVYGGMGDFPRTEVAIDLSSGLYNGVVNAGVIEYDLSAMRYDSKLSGPIRPAVLIINKIMGNEVYDLNKLEKFEAFSFE